LTKTTVIATGGLVSLVLDACTGIDHYEECFTLVCLRLLCDCNIDENLVPAVAAAMTYTKG
jgi:hypothetical protein